MDTATSTNGALNGGGAPHLTRAAARAARAAERAPPAPPAVRTAPKKRKKRGTGAKALATAAAKLAAAAGATPAKLSALPIASGKIQEHPLLIELSMTYRKAEKGWTPEQAGGFLRLSAAAYDTVCGFKPGTVLEYLKAA